MGPQLKLVLFQKKAQTFLAGRETLSHYKLSEVMSKNNRCKNYLKSLHNNSAVRGKSNYFPVVLG
jgi:hypothetical protein